MRDLIDYSIKIYLDQGVKQSNDEVGKDLLMFFRERMKNILKEKKIRNDIIEASISSHFSDNFLELYKKNLIMNKFRNENYMILVATTVIEVGIDIPQATTIVIEHA